MPDAMLPPARMRYSYESRCRVVRAVLDGATPPGGGFGPRRES